jgi:hypothetical protein
LSIGIIAAAGLVFFYVADRFAIFGTAILPAKPAPTCVPFEEGMLRPMWQHLRQHRLSHATLLPVIVVPVAVIIFWNDASSGYPLRQVAVTPPAGADATRSVLRIDGDADGDFVIFDHKRHQAVCDQGSSCQRCHHVYLPGDVQTPCHRCHGDMFCESSIFDHELHALRVGQGKAADLPKEPSADTCGETGLLLRHRWPRESGFAMARLQNASCTECHPDDEPKSVRTAVACGDCHGAEMGLSDEESLSFNAWAPSYVDAMHRQCIGCHKVQAISRGRPQLGDCQTCHRAEEGRRPSASNTSPPPPPKVTLTE